MKRFFIILAFFLLFINSSVFAANIVKTEYKIPAADGFMLSATLQYPKVSNKKNFSTVLLIHSLGYSSQWWETLPGELLNKGYAVLMLDLRGHGQSVYNSNLTQVSWKNLNNNGFAKYPDDIVRVVDFVKEENSKKTFFKNWAIVGSDIGASASVFAASRFSIKPKTIVMMSPIVNARGIYIPIKIADLNDVDILAISGTNDLTSQDAQNYLKKFAQSTFVTYVSSSKSNGMLMLKNDKTLSGFIAEWISEYLNR